LSRGNLALLSFQNSEYERTPGYKFRYLGVLVVKALDILAVMGWDKLLLEVEYK